MGETILVHGARQLLTLRGPTGPRHGTDLAALGIIQDGSLLIVDGVIQEVGTTRRVENLSAARHAREISAAGRVVMPGFVDAHTHLISGPPRLADYDGSLLSGNPPDASIALAGVNAVREASPKTLQSQAMKVADGMLEHGTTSMLAKSGFGLSEGSELKILRAYAWLKARGGPLVSSFGAARACPPEHADNRSAYLNDVAQQLPLVKKRRLAGAVNLTCDEGAFTASEALPFIRAAQTQGFALSIETGQWRSMNGVALAVDSRADAVCGLALLSETEARLLAASSVVAVLTPGASFQMAKAYAPARLLINSGAAIALATGYTQPSAPSYSMQATLSLACRMTGLTAAEAITASTLNAACAAGFADSAGSLEVGKNADLIILHTGDYRELPYAFGINMVSTVMKQGRIVFDREGKLD